MLSDKMRDKLNDVDKHGGEAYPFPPEDDIRFGVCVCMCLACCKLYIADKLFVLGHRM